jgi:DNA-binding response OmpR family regulator
VKFLFASFKSSEELSQVLFDPLIVLQEPGLQRIESIKRTLRFLIIEDDPTAGGLLHYILKQHGDCVLCESGSAALTVLREGWERGTGFDMVILDLFLPDIHGNLVLKEIREQEFQRDLPRCKVVINTASKDFGQLQQSLEMEPDGYLIKPINVDVLLDKITDLKAAQVEQVR